MKVPAKYTQQRSGMRREVCFNKLEKYVEEKVPERGENKWDARELLSKT